MDSKISQISIVPSIKSSHFSLAETEIVGNRASDEQLTRNNSFKDKQALEALQFDEQSLHPQSSETESLIVHLAKEYVHERRVFKLLFLVVNILAFILLSIITYLLVNLLQFTAFHPDVASDADFNIHLVCSILGSLILPAYGMLLFRVFPQVPYRTVVHAHVGINVVALLLNVFGIKVVYDAHHLYATMHLYSLHGWFGFTIFILQFFGLITGNWLYLRNFPQPIMKYCHGVAGTILFLWSGAATISGLLYRAQILIKNGTMTTMVQFTLNTFGCLCNVFGVLVRYLCSDYQFRRRPHPAKKKLTSSKSTHSKFHASLAVANPFAQDTFEYGAVRRSIFIGSQTYEQFQDSLRRRHGPGSTDDDDEESIADEDNERPNHSATSLFETAQGFYSGYSLRNPKLTRQSISNELKKLSMKRATTQEIQDSRIVVDNFDLTSLDSEMSSSTNLGNQNLSLS